MNHHKTSRSWVGSVSNKHNPSAKSGFDACISSRITTVIQVVSDHQINYNCFNEPFAVSPYRSLYWDMHGLIFETSIWLLAGSTRLLSYRSPVQRMTDAPGPVSKTELREVWTLSRCHPTGRGARLIAKFPKRLGKRTQTITHVDEGTVIDACQALREARASWFETLVLKEYQYNLHHLRSSGQGQTPSKPYPRPHLPSPQVVKERSSPRIIIVKEVSGKKWKSYKQLSANLILQRQDRCGQLAQRRNPCAEGRRVLPSLFSEQRVWYNLSFFVKL